MDLPDSLAPLLARRLLELSPTSNLQIVYETITVIIQPTNIISSALDTLRKGLISLSFRKKDREAATKPRTRRVRRSQRETRYAYLTRLFAHGATMRIHLTYFSDSKSKWMPPLRGQHIEPKQMGEVIDLWSHTSALDGASELAEAFLENYGIPNTEDWLEDATVDILELSPH